MGKTALVTGAASKLGQSIAGTLAGSGHLVFAAMRDPVGRNQAAAKSLRARGIEVVALDVADDASVAGAVNFLIRKAGPIEVVVNNARIAMIGTIDAFAPAQVQAVLNTNVVGVVRTSQAVLPGMRRAREGLIVNIGSVLGRLSLPFFGIHSAGNFALEALTDSLRYELAPSGVDVVLIQQSMSPVSMRVVASGEDEDGEGRLCDPARHSLALARISTRVEMASTPDPGGVCSAICGLVNEVSGSRPYRLVIGETFGVEQLNRLAETLQREALESVGNSPIDAVADGEDFGNGNFPADGY